jgi:DedD protein
MATRDGELFKETIQVSLDGRQIFCLFAGGAVIASLVFVLGVMVGRRVEARAHPERAGASGAAGDPLAALDRIAASDGAADSELAFASALRGHGGDDALGPVDVSLEKKGQKSLSDAPGLGGDAPDDGDADSDGEAPPAAEPDSDADPAGGAGAAAPAVQAQAAAKAKAPAAAAPADDKAAAGPAEVAPAKAHFTLQLSSFQSQAEANAFRQQLEKAGYQPYQLQAEVEGKGTWYRIRVGHYKDYDDAVAAKKLFEQKQKMIAYVTRIHGS